MLEVTKKVESSEKELEESIKTILGSMAWNEQDDGYYELNVDADREDELSIDSVAEILNDPDVDTKYDELLSEMYYDIIYEKKHDIREEVIEQLSELGYNITDDVGSYITDCLEDYVEVNPPYKHFNEKEYEVTIMVDTGDGNHDYVLNSVYPCYTGEKGEEINDAASIVWLAGTQGYTKQQLRDELDKGDMRDPKGFLESMRVELANLPSRNGLLVFLVKMKLDDLFTLNKMMKMQEPEGKHIFDARERPDCGKLVIGKECTCGLFDPFDGGGSVLEIQLENEVALPIRFVRCAYPDKVTPRRMPGRWSISDVYAMSASAWKDCLIEVVPPEKGENDV